MLLVASLVFGVVAMVTCLALRSWVLAALLAPLDVVLAVLVLHDDRDGAMDSAIGHFGDRLWASSRVARVSLRSWSQVGRLDMRLRSEEQRHRRELGRVRDRIGDAALAGNDAEVARLRDEGKRIRMEIDRRQQERRKLHQGVKRRVADERDATAPTAAIPVVPPRTRP
ncbi:MAG: hypothetical protein ACYDD4_05870 [Acidimicrobiales bacterium]